MTACFFIMGLLAMCIFVRMCSLDGGHLCHKDAATWKKFVMSAEPLAIDLGMASKGVGSQSS